MMNFHFDYDFALKAFIESVKGIPVTLHIVLVAFVIGFPLAFFIAFQRLKKTPVLSQFFTFYVSFVRGTPVTVKVLLFYAVLPLAIENLIKSLHLNFSIYDVNPILYAFIIYSMNASAAYSEIWRSALSGVDSGQYEAAVSVGLTPLKAYIHLIIPQAMVIGIPSFCSSTLSILKSTSIVFLMTILDITGRARLAAAMGYKYLEAYIVIFFVYLIVCGSLEQIFKLIERRITLYRKVAT